MNETRFTERAQAALRLAQEGSAELGHGYVGSEHLLLGLAREGKGVAAKVLQAAGRVIRSETDKGVALLIDERFCEERFARLLPRHYRVRRADSLSQVGALLSAFWAQPAQQLPQEERGQ